MSKSAGKPTASDLAKMNKPGELARRWPAYQGCWIALIGDQVAGVGRSREAAQLAARHSRPRERISQILYIPRRSHR